MRPFVIRSQSLDRVRWSNSDYNSIPKSGVSAAGIELNGNIPLWGEADRGFVGLEQALNASALNEL